MDVVAPLVLLIIGVFVGQFMYAKRAGAEKIKFIRQINDERKQKQELSEQVKLLQHSAQFQKQEAENRKKIWASLDVGDTKNQLRFIQQYELSAKPPINYEASSILYAIEDWLKVQKEKDPHFKWRLGFEVGLGAFIKTAKYDREDENMKRAFKSYNSKRVDFLLIDNRGNPKLAIEYNGSGHYMSADAVERMNVKSMALDRAGIPLLEIPKNMSRTEILNSISGALL